MLLRHYLEQGVKRWPGNLVSVGIRSTGGSVKGSWTGTWIRTRCAMDLGDPSSRSSTHTRRSSIARLEALYGARCQDAFPPTRCPISSGGVPKSDPGPPLGVIQGQVTG